MDQQPFYDEPININPIAPVQEEPITLDTGVTNEPVSEEIATRRATKAKFGLGSGYPKSYDEIYKQISVGNESGIRKDAASEIDFAKGQQLQNSIKDWTPEQIQQAIANHKPTDPNSVFEEAFAKKYVGALTEIKYKYPGTWLDDADNEIPVETEIAKGIGTDLIAKHQFSVKIEEDLSEKIKKQSWGGAGYDILRQSVPLYTSARLRGQDVPFFEGGLLGSHLEEERKALYRLPFDEFKARYTSIIDSLKDNLHLAREFAGAVSGQATDDVTISNLLEGVDVVGAPGAIVGGAALARRAVLLGRMKEGVKGVVKSTKVSGPSFDVTSPEYRAFVDSGEREAGQLPPQVTSAAGAGDLPTAAVEKATVQVIKDLSGTAVENEKAISALTSNFKLIKDASATNPGRYGQEIVNRINEIVDSTQTNLTNAIQTMMRVNRIPAVIATNDTIKAWKDGIKGNYKGIDNAILDITDPVHDPKPNVYRHEIYIGTPDGEFFKSPDVARNNAKLNGIVVKPAESEKANLLYNIERLKQEIKEGPSIDADVHELNRHAAMPSQLRDLEEVMNVKEGAELRQQGSGWYISIPKHMNEVDDIIRDGLVPKGPISVRDYKKSYQTGTSETRIAPSWFSGWVNATIGLIRTPAETMSIAENAQRIIATHGPSVLLMNAEETGKIIGGVPRKYWGDFDRFVKSSQKKVDPDTKLPGYFYKDPMEIESWYQTNLKRMPEKSEISAYFAWVSNIESDRVYRELAVYRNKARLGTESHNVYFRDGDGNKVSSGFFDGVTQSYLPGGRNDIIVVMGNKPGEEQFYKTNRIGKAMDDLKKRIESGELKVIEVFDPESRPLQGFGRIENRRVRYVITNNIETRPISYDQVPRRGGGHLTPDYDFYVKQPKIHIENTGGATHWYEGDTTILPISIRAMSDDIAKKMDAVRQLIKDDRIADAKAFNDTHLPFDWDEHYGWYKESHDPTGKKLAARLNLTERIRTVPKNTNITQLDNELALKYPDTFQDGTRSGSLARVSQVEFTGPRDSYELMTVNNKGTAKNPLYTYEPADLIDPITAMDRGLSRIINSTYLDDYKTFAVEHWLRQAAPYLEASESEIRSSPFANFTDYKFTKGALMENPTLVSALMSNHKKVKDFVGTTGAVDNFLTSMSQRMADSVYSNVSTRMSIVPTALLPYVKSPLQYMRSITFDIKMGLGSIQQFFTQATLFTNIFALSPAHAPSGTMAMTLYTASRYTKDAKILEYIDNLATNFRTHIPGMSYFKPGEWLEATKALEASGFANVGHEHAYLDTPISSKVIKNAKDTVLDWGRLPMTLGNKSTRVGGWYTAYREFRDLNPTGELSRFDLEKIMSRAALLDHNMTRAFSSTLHTGVMSIPFQFGAFAIRQAEMMTGKQLTALEKARMFTVGSIMWGVPVGGLGLYGYPIADYIRKRAADTGNYVVGENFLSQTVMEGLPAAIMQYITGNSYDVSKFGSKGLDQLEKGLFGDTTLWEMAGGATYSTFAHTISNTSGLWRWMVSWSKGDGQFKLKPDDLIDVLKEATSVNAFRRMIIAINTGKWLSRQETLLAKDVSAANALFMTITGLSPQQAQDTHMTSELIKEEKAVQKEYLQKFIRETHRAIQAQMNKDPAATDYFNRANAYLEVSGYPPEKRPQARALAAQESQTLPSRIDWNYNMKDVPAGEQEYRRDRYQRILRQGAQ